MKTCKWCNKEKTIESFYENKCSKDGRINKCKDCTKDRSIELIIINSFSGFKKRK